MLVFYHTESGEKTNHENELTPASTTLFGNHGRFFGGFGIVVASHRVIASALFKGYRHRLRESINQINTHENIAKKSLDRDPRTETCRI